MASNVIFGALSVGVRVSAESPLAEGAAIFRSISAERKDGQHGLDEDVELISASSVSRSPNVLPGETPTTLKDLQTHVLETV